jgi:hypothetical protein
VFGTNRTGLPMIFAAQVVRSWGWEFSISIFHQQLVVQA